MKKRIIVVFLVALLIVLIGCNAKEPSVPNSVSEVEKPIENKVVTKTNTSVSKDVIKDTLKSPVGVAGPGGCTGSACNTFFQNNPEEGDKWCKSNPAVCATLMVGDQGSNQGPGGCTNDCDAYCTKNEQECKDWCGINAKSNPELCSLINAQDDAESMQGDGVWDKKELTFYVKDEENVLTEQKRSIIVETITSTREGNGGYYGWNSALADLNKRKSDNKVPDKLVEVQSEDKADIVIVVHSVKEFCCDLTGDPITGKERSDIGDNSAKIRSNVDAYNIVNIDNGFLEDMMRHELGHSLGIFSHVTNRQNDLMSIVSPASVIKDANMDDLYIKYHDRIIETMEESIEADESVKDRKVRSTS